MGLVCFRLKGSNGMNQRLLTSINASGMLHMVPASLADKYVIRFCVCAQNASDDDIRLFTRFLGALRSSNGSVEWVSWGFNGKCM